MTLGQRIAFHRKQKGLTQQQLGEQLNVSAQAISKWENDQAEPDVSMLIRLAELFDISLNLLLTGNEIAATNETPVPEAADSVEEAPKATPKNKVSEIFMKHKKVLLPVACIILALAIVVPAFFVIASYTFMQPCSMYNYNRIDTEMSLKQVEDMLGLPHKKTSTKTVGGYSYDASNPFADTFMEGLLEAFTDDAEIVVEDTYFYYSGKYGRISAKIAKLEDKILNADIDTDINTLNKWEDEIEELQKRLKETDEKNILRITFKNKKVTEVHIKTQDERLSKP